MKGKIGENERTMWEMDGGGLCVLTSLGGQGAKGGAKKGPRHYEISRYSSDRRGPEGQSERVRHPTTGLGHNRPRNPKKWMSTR